MIAYRKQRRKVDPVKQILARVEERQNKSGLSLYSTKSNDEPSKDDILPMVHQLNDGASVSSKNTPFLADLSTARRKAHRRLNASSKHVANESKERSMQFSLKGGRQMNLTFPPAKPQKMAAGVNMNNLGYSFSGWSESSSAGVENLRSSHYTTQSMNPFGYSRRTLAFQPTSLNYVVEWPETWPLKIMSLNKGMGRSYKKKPKTKPKDERRVRFEQASAVHLSSPLKESMRSGVYIQEGVSAPGQSSLKLINQQRPLPSVLTQPFLQEAVGEHNTQEDRELHGVQYQCEAVSSDMLAPCIGPRREENLRGSSGVSSVSAESISTADKGIDEDHQLARNGTATVPPCTPTPDIPEPDQEIGSEQLDSLAYDLPEEGEETKKEGKEVEAMEEGEEEEEEADKVEGEEVVEVEKDDAQAKLMSVVSQIAAEPSSNYKQDI